MRAPGLADGTALSFRVVDQVIPLPYTVGGTHLNDPDWIPLYDGYTGGVDLAARIRKYLLPRLLRRRCLTMGN